MMKNRVQVFILLNSGQQKLMASSRDPLDVTVDVITDLGPYWYSGNRWSIETETQLEF